MYWDNMQVCWDEKGCIMGAEECLMKQSLSQCDEGPVLQIL